MQDLNSTMFYKAKFTMESKDNEQHDLLWKLVWSIRSWLIGKWNRPGAEPIVNSSTKAWSGFKLGSKLYDLQKLNRLFAESAYYQDEDDPSMISWACKIIERPDSTAGYAPREWITQIGFQTNATNSAEISYIVTYNDQAGFIGFCQPQPSVTLPKVIRWLLCKNDISCKVGKSTLSISPILLKPGDYPLFEKEIFNAERDIPIIYVSPKCNYQEDDSTQLLVDPKKLAESVAANARVYYADSLDFSREMSYLGNSNYYCAGGAIRIYRPHIDVNDENNARQHRFIAPQFIEEHGEEQIINMLRRALAQDVHFYETLFRIDDCRSLLENKQRRAKIRRIREQSQGEIDEATVAFMEESELRLQAEQEIRALQDDLVQKKAENYSLTIQLEMHKQRVERASMIESANDNVRKIDKYPATPLAIAKYFEVLYPERIAFTNRAYRSLEECITKQDILWEVFYHIVTDLSILVKEKPATAYAEFKAQTGWDCSRGEGMMTHADSKLMKQYIDEYEGHEINIEAHIKSGNRDTDPRSIRIYFAYDPSVADKIIVGHCGKHLDNYSTRKARK